MTRPLQHRQITVGVTDGGSRTAPYVMLDGHRLAFLVVKELDFRQPHNRRLAVTQFFAHLKRILRMGRLRLRGPSGARTEFLLAATAQNFAKLVPVPPSPITATI